MRFLVGFVALLLGIHTAVWAQKGDPNKEVTRGAPIGPDGMLPPSPYLDKPLPELKGVVSWRMLGEVTPVEYGFDPVVVSGRFVVLRDDPMGLYYRLTDAVAVNQ